MLLKMSKITSKGQVTIPVEVRRALGLDVGDTILFEKRTKRVHCYQFSRKLALSAKELGKHSIKLGKSSIRVCVDTNVFLNVLNRKLNFYSDSKEVLNAIDQGQGMWSYQLW
jgi:AbrB family looped-hinge helix DNA binding protein